MKKRFYNIMINGQKAVNAGYKLQNGFCYVKTPYSQLEVVVDDEGTYNGFTNKWVSVSFIDNASDIYKVMDFLANNGFAGCRCTVDEEIQNGCFSDTKTLFCTII
jgi:hypothetical protein